MGEKKRREEGWKSREVTKAALIVIKGEGGVGFFLSMQCADEGMIGGLE